MSAARANPGAKKGPVPSEEYADLSHRELRALRQSLMDEESRVSYWRRLVQARVDVLGSERGDHELVGRLNEVLADAHGAHTRLARISVTPVDDVEPLPDLTELWQELPSEDPVQVADLVQRLQEAEVRLSEFRRTLFDNIDRATQELIARYRQDPSLALTLLAE